MSDLFIGIDSGTQGTKAVVMDSRTGKVIAEASAKYDCIPGLPAGVKEQEPKTWVSALERTVKAVVKKSGASKERFKGIGISGQQHGLVPLDEQDEVIRPAKLWCDTSTASQAESLIQKLGGIKKVIALSGNGIPAGFTASKILWMKQHEPKNYARLASVLLPHDYLNFHLTGEKTMEAGDASGTALFDTKTRNWQAKMIAAIDPGLIDKLPPIQKSSAPAGELRHLIARKLGLNAGTLVSAGGGDNMMGAIGTGNTRVGVVTASLGTSGTIYAYSSRPLVDPHGEVAAFCDSTGAWLPLICTMNVTVATELIKSNFKWTNDKLTAAADKISPGSDGVMLLPYFNGERVPNFPQGSGMFFGLNTDNFTPGHLARASMEGVTMGLNYGLGRMQDLGLRPKQIRVTGGGARNPLWRQIMADIFEAEVVALQSAEGAALGAAIQALWSYRLHKGDRCRIAQLTDELVKVDPKTACSPNRERVKRYRKFQEMHVELAKSGATLFPKHASMLSQIG